MGGWALSVLHSPPLQVGNTQSMGGVNFPVSNSDCSPLAGRLAQAGGTVPPTLQRCPLPVPQVKAQESFSLESEHWTGSANSKVGGPAAVLWPAVFPPACLWLKSQRPASPVLLHAPCLRLVLNGKVQDAANLN